MAAERWVVKLGGSWHDAPQLRDWLAALAQHGGGRLIIVPGGGPFADAVRAVQPLMGLTDATAHRLAIRAMELYAQCLCEMQPKLVAAANETEMQQQLASGSVPVWMPSVMLSAATDITTNWSVSSDSLAAWLARRLSARALVLLKRVPATIENNQIHCQAKKAVDENLHQYLPHDCQLYWFTPDQLSKFLQEFVTVPV